MPDPTTPAIEGGLTLWSSLQEDAQAVELERGVSGEGLQQKALILAEEIFEVLKVLRARAGVATGQVRAVGRLGEELADLTFVTAAIANRIPLRLDDAVAACMAEKNWASLSCRSKNDLDALQLGLTLASEVLSVLQSVQVVEQPGRDGIESASASLKESLGHILIIATVLAEKDAIDLGEAICSKLDKDQLRLWTVAEPADC